MLPLRKFEELSEAEKWEVCKWHAAGKSHWWIEKKYNVSRVDLAQNCADLVENHLLQIRPVYTKIPHSELALHAGIAGKTGRIVSKKGRSVTVEVEGKTYEGRIGELIGHEERVKLGWALSQSEGGA
jgi:hypothetical protein